MNNNYPRKNPLWSLNVVKKIRIDEKKKCDPKANSSSANKANILRTHHHPPVWMFLSIRKDYQFENIYTYILRKKKKQQQFIDKIKACKRMKIRIFCKI